jgi:hypothetical protein
LSRPPESWPNASSASEAGGRLEDQLRFAFRSLTGRQPADGELSILTRHFEEELERFDRNPEVVRQLFTAGERARDPLLEPVRTAALAVVMNTLMNHDEFAMKR